MCFLHGCVGGGGGVKLNGGGGQQASCLVAKQARFSTGTD